MKARNLVAKHMRLAGKAGMHRKNKRSAAKRGTRRDNARLRKGLVPGEI